jgi:type IV pilus assembly protein PilC
MSTFKYTAIDSSGKQKEGKIKADSKEQANSKISAMGLMPTHITALSAIHAAPKSVKVKSSKKGTSLNIGKIIKEEELAIFTRQLATLLTAGLPLLRGLEVMIRQEKNERFKEVVNQIADQVRSGNAFSDGLAQHPKVFDRLFVNMVKAGEAGGVLDTVLGRLAGFMEKALRTKKKVKAALVYPIVVVSVAVIIVALLMVVVVPRFQGIFADMLGGQALPVPTQIVINISTFIQTNIMGTVLIVVGFFVGMSFIKKTAVGKKIIDVFSLKTPKLGDLVQKVNIARITRTFGTLLSSGVPILQAITITKDIVSNSFYTHALNRVHDSVRDGESLAAPMERESVFPAMVTSMVDVGEETGELAEMLTRIADNYDEDVDNAVAGITSIIEPVMIVFLAVVVGFIVIALFLPIVEIIQQLTV